MPACQEDDPAPFLVLPPQARRSPTLKPDCVGHQRELLSIAGGTRDATVVYAADLGRAQAIATGLRAAGCPLILFDVHAFVADDLVAWRQTCTDSGRCRSAGQLPSRLSYCGTVGGLRSYLADIAALRIVDGVILSEVDVAGAFTGPSVSRGAHGA